MRAVTAARADAAGVEFSTVRDYRNSINGYLSPRWGGRPVATITREDVKALRDDLLTTKRRVRTAGGVELRPSPRAPSCGT
jgi:hypothetical protein